MERAFLDGDSRSLRAAKGQTQRTRYSYKLPDGLYEVCESDSREYLAIVKNRRVPLSCSDVEYAADLCKKWKGSLASLIREWLTSQNPSSDSFTAMAVAATANNRARINEVRRTRQKLRAVQRQERINPMTANEAFDGSDAAETRSFVKRLREMGVEGAIAAELFRCQKASTRAKMYHGKYRNRAYARKGDSLGILCAALKSNPQYTWGWKLDPGENFATWVLYVELPQGQVSFHARERGDGPDYVSEWDGQHESEDRILAYCDSILAERRGTLDVPGLAAHSDTKVERTSAVHDPTSVTSPA